MYSIYDGTWVFCVKSDQCVIYNFIFYNFKYIYQSWNNRNVIFLVCQRYMYRYGKINFKLRVQFSSLNRLVLFRSLI